MGQSKARVYPNPTSGKLQITLPSFYENVEAQLFNNLGQVVEAINLGNGSEFEVNTGLTAGIYRLRLYNETSEISNFTIMM